MNKSKLRILTINLVIGVAAATALQKCFTQLGITRVRGFGGGVAPTPTATK